MMTIARRLRRRLSLRVGWHAAHPHTERHTAPPTAHGLVPRRRRAPCAFSTPSSNSVESPTGVFSTDVLHAWLARDPTARARSCSHALRASNSGLDARFFRGDASTRPRCAYTNPRRASQCRRTHTAARAAPYLARHVPPRSRAGIPHSPRCSSSSMIAACVAFGRTRPPSRSACARWYLGPHLYLPLAPGCQARS